MKEFFRKMDLTIALLGFCIGFVMTYRAFSLNIDSIGGVIYGLVVVIIFNVSVSCFDSYVKDTFIKNT